MNKLITFSKLIIFLILISLMGYKNKTIYTKIPVNKKHNLFPFKRGLGFWPTNYNKDFLNNTFQKMSESTEIALIQIDDWNTHPKNCKKKLEFYDKWIIFARKKDIEIYLAFEPFDGDRKNPRFLIDPYITNEIPDNYFSILKEKCDLAIFIAEIGFYSGSDANPKSSREEQAIFIKNLPGLLKNTGVIGVCWVSVNDLNDTPALTPLKKTVPHFFTLGLLTENLEPKPSWYEWCGININENY